MDLDTQRIRDLLDKRDELDQELSAIFAGAPKERKQQRCSSCLSTEHTARNCPKKNGDNPQQS